MALGGSGLAGETNAVVVEPTPRFKQRHPAWTPAALAYRVGRARSGLDSVRVTGFLALRPLALESYGALSGDPMKVHPVTRIEVFDPSRGGWVNLDDL